MKLGDMDTVRVGPRVSAAYAFGAIVTAIATAKATASTRKTVFMANPPEFLPTGPVIPELYRSCWSWLILLGHVGLARGFTSG